LAVVAICRSPGAGPKSRTGCAFVLFNGHLFFTLRHVAASSRDVCAGATAYQGEDSADLSWALTRNSSELKGEVSVH